MISKQMKIKLVAIIASVAFLGTVVFGLIFMMDATMKMDQQSMAGDCPFTMFSGAACPQSALGAIAHHISLYQSFTNASVNFGFAALMISLLLAVSAILAIFIGSFSLELSVLTGILYNYPPDSSYKRKISRWLSLHENSPAII